MPQQQTDRVISQVKESLQTSGSLHAESLLLLAVSGGVDSMVLLHAVWKIHPKIAVAHCNFHLRGDESNEDEMLVKQVAELYQIPVFVSHFETKQYSEFHHLSVQQAARELRYKWFEDLRTTISADWILTAHHADDQLETFFINLSRGSGIAGLSGIPDGVNHLLRPLLQLSKSEILRYANDCHLKFREDSSNTTLKYLRNSIRLKLIPFLNENFKGMGAAALESVSHLRQVNAYYQDKMKSELLNLVQARERYQYIPQGKLKDNLHTGLILHEWLYPYGFSKDNLMKAEALLKRHQSGFFSSSSYKLYIEKEAIYLQKKEEEKVSIRFSISEEEILHLEEPVKLRFEATTGTSKYQNAPPDVAYLDLDITGSEFELRKWEKGDTFIPLGMKGLKKVSDYFIDKKFSRFKKENTYLLISGGVIRWIIGERISESCKITEMTKKVLTIHVDKSLE